MNLYHYSIGKKPMPFYFRSPPYFKFLRKGKAFITLAVPCVILKLGFIHIKFLYNVTIIYCEYYF
jgi:hypothetical protein